MCETFSCSVQIVQSGIYRWDSVCWNFVTNVLRGCVGSWQRTSWREGWRNEALTTAILLRSSGKFVSNPFFYAPKTGWWFSIHLKHISSNRGEHEKYWNHHLENSQNRNDINSSDTKKYLKMSFSQNSEPKILYRASFIYIFSKKTVPGTTKKHPRNYFQ